MNRQLALGLQLRDTARFENFVAGANDEAVAQLQRCADGRDEGFYFCWGVSGCGKSHLLQAACHRAAGGEHRVAYVSLRDSALQPALLEGWENFDLVCVDDLDAVAGVPAWEEALFHLYNRLRGHGGSLIVSAALAPAQLPVGLPDLRSRLSAGITYQLKPPGDEQLLQALQLRARRRGCEIPDDTATYLLRRLPRDSVSLFDMLDRLDEASLVAQRKLTVPFVKSVLGL